MKIRLINEVLIVILLTSETSNKSIFVIAKLYMWRWWKWGADTTSIGTLPYWCPYGGIRNAIGPLTFVTNNIFFRRIAEREATDMLVIILPTEYHLPRINNFTFGSYASRRSCK